MGRDLSWFVVKLPNEHDKTKPICLDLECEPEKNDIDFKYRLYQIIRGEKEINDFDMKQYKEVSQLWYTYKYKNKDQWCPKCHFYNCSLYDSDSIIDRFHIQHSYSNPIWQSKWNIRDFHLGSHNTDLIRRFSSEHLYREILHEDITGAYKKIERLGEPIRRSDVEAKEECINILAFLKKYVNRDDVNVIMQDEY